jgi:hypothetical protein
MRHVFASAMLWLAVPVIAQAQSTAASAAAPAQVTTLEATTVSGVMPGPGLWKVSKGDHVLWILGTLSPLPQRMQWESRDLEDAISHSQQLLLTPTIKPKVDVSFFGKLFLLPSAYSARKNDNGATLQQILPAPVYARWLALKQKYIGNDSGIERWRPIFASQQLYKKAIKANDLSNSGGVQSSVDALAKKYNVPEIPTTYEVVIEHPHDAIKTFKSSGIDDLACFNGTLDSIEHDMPGITARANAWATGDVQALRTLPHSDRMRACVNAITGADFARKLGFADAPQKLETIWLNAARTALQNNRQTVAMLPMDQLLSANGYLSALKAQGYQIEAPEEDSDADAGSTP